MVDVQHHHEDVKPCTDMQTSRKGWCHMLLQLAQSTQRCSTASIAGDAHCSIDVARSAHAIMDVLSPVAVGVVGVEDGVGGGGVLKDVGDAVAAGGLLFGDGGTAQQARVYDICDEVELTTGLVCGPDQLSTKPPTQYRKT